MSKPRYINPKRQWVGAFMPNWLCVQRSVSANAKIVYARLMQFCDETGRAWPLQSTLAEAVGMEIRTLQRALSELEQIGLIHKHQRGRNRSNYYMFPTHPFMASPVLPKVEPPVDNSPPASKGHDKSVAPDTTNLSCPDTTNLSDIKDVRKDVIKNVIHEATRSVDAIQRNDVPKEDRKARWQSRIETEIWRVKPQREAERVIRDYAANLYYARQYYEEVDRHLKSRRSGKRAA